MYRDNIQSQINDLNVKIESLQNIIKLNEKQVKENKPLSMFQKLGIIFIICIFLSIIISISSLPTVFAIMLYSFLGTSAFISGISMLVIWLSD